MRSVSRGYLVPTEVSVRAKAWTVRLSDGVEVDAVDAVPDWDYFTPVRLRRSVAVDRNEIVESCQLDGGAALALVAIWHSSWTGLRDSTRHFPVNGDGCELSFELPGDVLGGVLTIETRLVLDEPGESTSPLAAYRPGSILWSDRSSLALEGTGSRFPLVPISFATANLAGGRMGLWCLMIETTDLEASALGALRLYINTDNPLTADLLASIPDPAATQLLSFIQFDVARQLLHFGIGHDEIDLNEAYPEASLGQVVVNLIRLFHAPLPELRARFRTEPGDLESEFQALTRLFEGRGR